MNTNSTHTSIKDLAVDDRPREKLLINGKQYLSNAELIAILIGSGNREESAVQLAQRILRSVDNDINKLGRFSIKDLQRFKGIGQAKAISIIAGLELSKRANAIERQVEAITSSKDASALLIEKLQFLPHEEFWVILLSRSNKVIGVHNISRGGVAGTVVDAKIIMKIAVEHLASGVILGHNHPSGNLKPSAADLNLTKKIKEGAKLLDVNILDHLIIADQLYFSFADEGLM